MAFSALAAQMVCELLESQEDDCQSLRQCCLKADVNASTFLRWCDEGHCLDDGVPLAKHYARADRIATDVQFERFQELNDSEPVTITGKSGAQVVDSGWVQWRKMQLDNRKWAMSKRRPSKFADRIEVKDKDANDRLNELVDAMKQGAIPRGQVNEEAN